MVDQSIFSPLFGFEYYTSIEENYSFWSRGIVFKNSDLCVLERLIPKNFSLEKVAELASNFNGFFSFVIQKKNRVVAIIDRVRSFPLFYSIWKGILYLGDDPYRIQEKLGDRQTDPVAMAELYLTGYVTGDSTFDPRIKQIPAGEIFSATIQTDGKWMIQRQIYYRFHHRDEFDFSCEELMWMGQDQMDQAIQRMIQVANGAMIAVPLSGGYDSRFILLTLKKLKYQNVLAFTYGVPGNEEAVVSKAVADDLGISWRFVAYTPELWRGWLDSPEFVRYQREGEKMVSVAHVQDWPAVWELKRRGIFQKETLFAPGHSGDFLGGKQIRPTLMKREGWSRAMVAKEVWDRHYTNSSTNVAFLKLGLSQNGKEAIWEKILTNLDGWDASTLDGANNAYNCEFWQEKLSKFIVNSMRVYEFWGYRWWLPFYDKCLVSFWEKVPFQWRKEKVLYDGIVEKLQEKFELEKYKNHQKRISNVQRLRKRMNSKFLELLIWRFHGKRILLNNYILGIQQAFPKKEFLDFIKNKGNINGYLASIHHKKYCG